MAIRMKRIYVLLALVVAVSGWRLSDLARDEWQTFKLEHKKYYVSPEEEQHRMIIYLNKRHMIAKHNRRFGRGLESFRLKTNQFSDMTHQEYLKIATGFKPISGHTSKHPASMFLSPANVIINETVDWRQDGAVSNVQDQRCCNSCWAFSATDALEGQLYRKNNKLVPLSAQNLVDCSKQNSGCWRGNTITAFQYIEENKGIDVEEYYPYVAMNDTCRYKPQYSGGYNLGFTLLRNGDEELLKEAVATIGPVSAAVDGSLDSFSTYSDGVYYDNRCNQTLNHAILVVGYGTDEREGDYWILKNSYGTKWGENGYMRLARNRQNHCGIASFASYPQIPN